MKKIKNFLSFLLALAIPLFICFLFLLSKGQLTLENGAFLWNIVFDRNLDFMILGFVIMFVFGTQVVQNFIYKKTYLKLNIDEDLFIFLIFFTMMLSFVIEYLLDENIFQFLKPLSLRPTFHIFSLSFLILFIASYLVFLVSSIKAKAPFLEYCIFYSSIIAIPISVFLSFFVTLFWTIRVNASNWDDRYYILISSMIFLIAFEFGKVFEKDKEEDQLEEEDKSSVVDTENTPKNLDY